MKLSFAIVIASAMTATGLVSHQAAATPCVRPAVGAVAQPPKDLYASRGSLKVTFDYFTEVDSAGRTLFCFVTPNGIESPTLHVNPGDTLEVTLHNKVPRPAKGSPTELVSDPDDRCGAAFMTLTSVNIHFHGTNTAPTCHADQVVHTIVNSDGTFTYTLKFPANEPPGLYWYHPHVHGISEAALQGGASGAIVVEGIEKIQPAVAGLGQRLLLIRDQNIPATVTLGKTAPSWDLSLNYVPILYPAYKPAVLRTKSGTREFWRVVNASADTIVQLVLDYDGVPQPLEIVALDGVPTGSQDGTRHGTPFTVTGLRLPPAGRAEFIVAAPGPKVKNATLFTPKIDTGPLGDSDPERPLATIDTVGKPEQLPIVPAVMSPPAPQRFEGLTSAAVTATRRLYFSEVEIYPPASAKGTGAQPDDNDQATFRFFITAGNQVPVPFDPLARPAITTHQGAVEDWTIENRSGENHEFHIHQIHFLVMARNGVPVPPEERQYRDTFEVPYWTGSGPYPSVTVRMDFRGADIGDFVYHCHILGHEDAGMMAIIRVLPRTGPRHALNALPDGSMKRGIAWALAFAEAHLPSRLTFSGALASPAFAEPAASVLTKDWRFPPSCSTGRRRIRRQ